MSKPLFTRSAIAQEEKEEIISLPVDELPDVLLCKSSDALQELFPSLKQNHTIDFVSKGQWSTHELVLHLLTLTGPAAVYFTTYSLKEYPVRLLLDAMEKGVIKQLYALLDSRVKSRTPQVYQLAEHNFSEIKMAECPAKVCVIENETWTVTVLGSANWTNNPRIEAGYVSTIKERGFFHRTWIAEVLIDAHPFI